MWGQHTFGKQGWADVIIHGFIQFGFLFEPTRSNTDLELDFYEISQSINSIDYYPRLIVKKVKSVSILRALKLLET